MVGRFGFPICSLVQGFGALILSALLCTLARVDGSRAHSSQLPLPSSRGAPQAGRRRAFVLASYSSGGVRRSPFSFLSTVVGLHTTVVNARYFLVRDLDCLEVRVVSVPLSPPFQSASSPSFLPRLVPGAHHLHSLVSLFFLLVRA